MFSISQVFFVGVAVGAVLGLVVGALLAWALLRTRDNRQIHQQVTEMTRTVTALVETALTHGDPKHTNEEKAAT